MAGKESTMRLLITGGGTGGHLFPAVAAAQALRERMVDSQVLFIGTRRKIDTTSLGQYGFESRSISSYGLKGKNVLELTKALAILPVSVMQAISHIRKFKPDVALGVGGYVTGPVMMAAKLLGIPTVIHEQNSIPGMANRKLGKLVNHVCVSLPGSEKYFPAEKTVFTGNPVRTNIKELAAAEPEAEKEKQTLLVLGGSQGAQAVNTMIADIFCDKSSGLADSINLIHQTGSADYEKVKEQYEKCGVSAEVEPFFQDMGSVYRQTDFLVSRAGATTLTELAVLGKPAILIPYPHAADNHQQKNAEYYVQGGGALVFEQSSLDAEKLSEAVRQLVDNRDKQLEMGAAMKALGKPEAADKIVDVCIAAAGKTS